MCVLELQVEQDDIGTSVVQYLDKVIDVVHLGDDFDIVRRAEHLFDAESNDRMVVNDYCFYCHFPLSYFTLAGAFAVPLVRV
jgi:hypothetical protein